MKFLYLLFGMTFLVLQTQAQDIQAQDKTEIQQLNQLEAKVKLVVMETEHAADMKYLDPAQPRRRKVCSRRGVCKPRCSKNENSSRRCRNHQRCCVKRRR